MVDTLEDGAYLVIMRYHMHGSAVIVGELNSWKRPTAQTIRQSAESRNASHVWTFSAEPEVTSAFNLSLPAGYSYLLARSTQGWSVVRRWAHPKPRFKAKPPTQGR